MRFLTFLLLALLLAAVIDQLRQLRQDVAEIQHHVRMLRLQTKTLSTPRPHIKPLPLQEASTSEL